MPALPGFGLHEQDFDYSQVLHSGITNVTDGRATSLPAMALQLYSNIVARSSYLGNSNSVDASKILALHQRHTIQVITTVTASISIIAAICAIYWFCLMRRNFRRDLILLLIAGDFSKSTVYMLYGAVTFARGPVTDYSRFCTATGYLLEMSLELCDMAIFLMSLHMSLQIFPPAQSILGHDGLYRVRYWMFAAWLIVPNVMASLAFANPGPAAYMSTGAFCWLPIRPFWYRLALSWIPRYMIWVYILYVAIRIYRHVGAEFKMFGQERDASSSLNMPAPSSVDRAARIADAAMSSRRASKGNQLVTNEKEADLVAPDDISAQKQETTTPSMRDSPAESADASRQTFGAATPNWSSAFGFGPDATNGTSGGNRSATTSRRGSHQIAPGVMAEDFAAPSNFDLGRHRASVTTVESSRTSATPSYEDVAQPALQTIREGRNSSDSAASDTAQTAANRVMDTRRRAIQRQLRLLFIYPVAYTILWLMPFVSHCFNYSNYYAQHPIFVISAINSFCQTFMGFTDVCIFCWRERPWRHIPGSDGTFLGSFCFWRFCWRPDWMTAASAQDLSEKEADAEANMTEQSRSSRGLLASIRSWSVSHRGSSTRPSHSSGGVNDSAPMRPKHRRNFSGGSDRKHLEVERAHTRLAMERADWEQHQRALQERRQSHISVGGEHSAISSPRKEWWDRQLGHDLYTVESSEDYDVDAEPEVQRTDR